MREGPSLCKTIKLLIGYKMNQIQQTKIKGKTRRLHLFEETGRGGSTLADHRLHVTKSSEVVTQTGSQVLAISVGPYDEPQGASG